MASNCFGLMDFGGGNDFQRATTLPATPKASRAPAKYRVSTAGALPNLNIDEASPSTQDDELESLPSPVPRRRSYSEPAPSRRIRSLFAALDAVDSSLPFSKGQATIRVSSMPVNMILCAVSLVVGCLVPVLVDLSRTATAFSPDGETLGRRPPYAALSVIGAEAAFNVALGIAAIAVRRPLGGFSVLWSAALHRAMLPLTLVYCLGDIAALSAIGRGGGPLYIAVASSRLLFAAAASHVLIGRRQSLRQWILLAEITAATGLYAVLSTSSGAADRGGASSSAAHVSIGWALLKAMLSGVAAVLTELRYKRLNLWHANTLLKMQSLAVALIAIALQPLFFEEVALCDPSVNLITACVDKRGWDAWTWAVLAAEVGAGWLSVAVLTRMSAIAKFVCKTATAPTIYLLYCAKGFGGLTFQVPSFLAVAMIAAGILAYLAEPHLVYLRRVAADFCVTEYRH
ncbi:unnamed protein product [Polarella glacialis]|uniref:Uncharacterized protein n=1 Tax=Polarella glacialis TaxID=89957 RepID=A0A813H6R4_POLGL|nr:unnamed protein product [Polarella glacialis]